MTDPTDDDQDLIDTASSIITSGRWDAVNGKIETLAILGGSENLWRRHLFALLCAQAFSEYNGMRDQKNRKDLSHTAWRARNLLELSVWCLYCKQDEKNAWRFYEDSAIDAKDLFTVFEKWGKDTRQGAEWFESGIVADQHLSEQTRLAGINPVRDRYTEVANAAKESVLGDYFGKRTTRAVLTGSGDLEFGQALVREAVPDMGEKVAAFGFGS